MTSLFSGDTLVRLIVIIAVSTALAGFRAVFIPVGNNVSIDTQEAVSLNVAQALQLGDRVVWIDARSEAEFQTDHIPEALWMNETNFESGMDELLDQWSSEDILVVYCSSKTCDSSKHLAGRLKQSGFSTVFVLEGGWEAWQKR